MALGTPTVSGKQGQTTMRPNFVLNLQVAGDDAYATGGTADIAAAEGFLESNLGYQVNVTAIQGLGKTGGAVTHFAEYDAANDKLKVYTLAGAEASNAADLSGVTFDLVIFAR